jgi:hypothetical protein
LSCLRVFRIELKNISERRDRRVITCGSEIRDSKIEVSCDQLRFFFERLLKDFDSFFRLIEAVISNAQIYHCFNARRRGLHGDFVAFCGPGPIILGGSPLGCFELLLGWSAISANRLSIRGDRAKRNPN